MQNPALPGLAPLVVKFGDTALEIVPSYKYLGIDITDSLDGSVHWLRISIIIRQNIALLKQLKSSGLETPILVTVFMSLFLSHLSYGSVLLDSCTQDGKRDMQLIQNRMLRIIGISKEVALTQYNILSMSDFIEKMCIMQVTKVLHSQEHTLPASLRTTRRIHSNFQFELPGARTEKFNNSAVMLERV